MMTMPTFEAPADVKSSPDFYSVVVRAILMRIALERGTPAAAPLQFPKLDWAGLPPIMLDLPMLHGEILCASGRRSEGLALLDQSIEWQEKKTYAHSPDLARARAVTGLCALADGQRTRAIGLAASARASFVAQPDVGKFFKAPLLDLEQKLRSN